MRRAGDRRLRYLIDNIRGTLVRKAAGYMRGTAALQPLFGMASTIKAGW
ncbi:hypothetical protein [Bradyrhizobium canariense]|nr:hypothetical protein [Bradyrhizobium canariense]